MFVLNQRWTAIRICALAVAGVIAAGCSFMPGEGPTAATISVAEQSGPDRPFYLIDVDRNILSGLAAFRDPPLSEALPRRDAGVRGRGAPHQTIGVGDTLQLTVFEAGDGGLFSQSAGELGGGAKNVTLPPQVVEADGTIGVPYAGRIQAAGRTPVGVAGRVEAALQGKALDPQVVVTIVKNQSNLVTVSGTVGSPGRVELRPGGERLLDVLANAGGPQGNINELFVQVTRDNLSGVLPLRRIIEQPSENVYLLPDDLVFVFREPQVFTAFGATGQSGNFPFEYDRMSIAEAMGAASGLNDNRADPKGVFVYRTEAREVVCALEEIYDCDVVPDTVAVIYRLNLHDPSGLFLAKEMHVRNDDVLYVANAGAADLLKFLRIVGVAAGVARTGAAFD